MRIVKSAPIVAKASKKINKVKAIIQKAKSFSAAKKNKKVPATKKKPDAKKLKQAKKIQIRKKDKKVKIAAKKDESK